MRFLSELAAEIINPQTIDYKDIAVVLPNKRAQKSLDMELAHAAGRSIFPPVVFSIDELVSNLSGLEVLPMTELLLELYGVYQTVAAAHHTETDDFQKFMSWGTHLIGDFNDIDRQLADAHEVFSYLKDYKDIGIEIDSDGNPTAGQRRYLEFYGMLYEIYTAFGEALRQKGKAYPGLIYRTAAENISELSKNQNFKKYYFAGLNAMTPAESRIIHHLYQEGKVQFFFDFDPFYLEYTAQIRDELAKTFHIEEKDIRNITDHYGAAPKTIRTYGVSKTMNQIYQAVEILNQLKQDDPTALDRTAVVFADESLIVPFVHAYNHTRCNISKKYPARATAAYRLLQILLGMARNYQRFQNQESTEDSNETAAYYHKDVMLLYRDPIVEEAFFSNTAEHQAFICSLVESNRLFFSRRTLNERLPDSCPDVTSDGHRLLEAIASYFRLLAARLGSHDKNNSGASTVKLLSLFADAADRAAELLRRFDSATPIDTRVAEFFLNEQIDQLDLSFKGDRSSGLQVMGLLETRTLDFDHVVMLSVNEGVLPSGNTDNSLILFEIKKKFHLSTYEQNDAIYGYHFFHLLQRAKDIHLIYNADSSGVVAEESRFVKQIAFKKQKGHYDNITLEQIVKPPLPVDSGQNTANEIVVKNSETVRKKLREFHFSASSLSTYLNCPLQFYLKHIAQIVPAEEIDENVEQNVIGLVIHTALEQLGKAVIENPGTPPAQLVDEWAGKIKEDYILDLFNERDEVRGQDLLRGRLYLATEVVRKTLAAYLPQLRDELASGRTQIIGCERRFSCRLDVGGTAVQLTGFADRIDLHDGKVAILDYKSGKSHSTCFSEIGELFTDVEKKHIFQLFIYMLLYKYRNREDFPADRFPDTDLEAGIVYLRDTLKGENATHYAEWKEGKGANPSTAGQQLEEFEKNLKLLIKNLLETPAFQQAEDAKHCDYCDYAGICHT
ncbi:MAG: PD-(D/E)XK nuclease family protein [Bacteroidales bacterium]|nr:PD-(D/E)XK nuclease family protein [Bacteroidales bacterium]